MIENALQVLVVVLVIIKLRAIGTKKRYGWAVGVAAEIPWLVLAYFWGSWALAALAVLYMAMYARYWVAWGKA